MNDNWSQLTMGTLGLLMVPLLHLPFWAKIVTACLFGLYVLNALLGMKGPRP